MSNGAFVGLDFGHGRANIRNLALTGSSRLDTVQGTRTVRVHYTRGTKDFSEPDASRNIESANRLSVTSDAKQDKQTDRQTTEEILRCIPSIRPFPFARYGSPSFLVEHPMDASSPV